LAQGLINKQSIACLLDKRQAAMKKKLIVDEEAYFLRGLG